MFDYWQKEKLSAIAPSCPLKVKDISPTDSVWQVNLDDIESHTGRLLQRKVQPFSKSGASTQWFDHNHVLYSKLRPYLNKVFLPTEQGLGTSELVPLLPDPRRLSREFLAYYLKSHKFLNWISGQTSGAKMPRVSMKIFWEHEIPLPPLAEQKQIAAILDAADSLRQKDQQLVEHYAALSQSLFLEMFGDPVSNPLRWEILCLGDLGDWHSGGTPDRKNADYFIGDIPWITSGELNNTYIKDSKEHISEIAIKNSAAKIIDKGSLLLGMYDTAALKSSITQEIVSCNQAIAFSKLNAIKANTVFVYSMIQCGKEHYRRLQRGVRQQNLNLTMIKEIRVIHPPISLQNQFAERVAIIEQQKQQAQTNLQKSEALFNSLLQRAFTGELTADKAA